MYMHFFLSILKSHEKHEKKSSCLIINLLPKKKKMMKMNRLCFKNLNVGMDLKR